MKVRDLRFIVLGQVLLKQGHYDEGFRMYRSLNEPCKISELPEEYLDLGVMYIFTLSETCLYIQVEDELPFSGEVDSDV